MPYPRLLNLDADTETRLVSYLETELHNHNAERTERIEDLMRWQHDYWARPTTEKATFPYHGASTLTIPLSAIAIETVHAKHMTTRFALADMVSVHAVSPDWDDFAVPVERFMNHELLTNMKIRRPMGDCFLNAEKYGTMIGKVIYERQVKTTVREINGVEQELDIVVKDGANFSSVLESRFIMPYGALDPQNAAWCGEEHSADPYYVMQLERGGMFAQGTVCDQPGWERDSNKLSKLHVWLNQPKATSSQTALTGNKFERSQEELENRPAQWPKRLDWVELYLAFDIDGSGILKELEVHYHRDSRTLLAVRYNSFSDCRRPYRIQQYFPVENRWTGIGICKQNEQFQPEITTQHRQRLDNATLANMRMLKVHKLSGYGPREPIFPGKMWFLNDMEHVESFQMAEIYPSGYNNEQASLIYSQMRSGVGELQLGQAQVGTPGTATSDLARIQEGNRKADFVYANFNEFTGEIVIDVADITQQYGPRKLAYYDTAENGNMVRQFFQMPASYIRDNLLLKLKPTTQAQNELLDRQNWQQLAAFIQQYYTGMVQLASEVGNPQLAQIIVMKGMGAATEAMRQILNTFDVRNVDRLIVKEVEDMVRNGLQQLGSGPNANTGNTGTSQVPAMAQLGQMLSIAQGSGNGLSPLLLGR
jgi:hypothetical protein